MAYLYFACDWLIESQPVHNGSLRQMIDTATALQCAISEQRMISPEGYLISRFVIRVSSREMLDEFVRRTASRMKLVNWFHVSREDAEQIITPSGALQYGTYNANELWTMHAHLNASLRDKLSRNDGLHYGCDWVVPVRVAASFLWKLQDVFSGSSLSNWGNTMRLGEVGLTNDGFYIQRFIARVFQERELVKFVRAKGDETGLKDWFPVSKQDFWDSQPMMFDLDVHQDTLERMSADNAARRAEIYGDIPED